MNTYPIQHKEIKHNRIHDSTHKPRTGTLPKLASAYVFLVSSAALPLLTQVIIPV